MSEVKTGTYASDVQMSDGLSLYRYWVRDGRVNTEGVTLGFADAKEFKAFLRAVERYGRKQGYLPKTKRTPKVAAATMTEAEQPPG